MAGHPVVAELDDLADVDLSAAPTNGQILSFDEGSGLWKPGASAGGIVLSSTLADIQATADTAALGNNATAAPSNHVHQTGVHGKRGRAHSDKYRRATALAESIDRDQAKDSLNAPTTGRGLAVAIVLSKGTPVTKIGFRSSSTTAGAGLTHTWFALLDSAFNKLAVTADDTSATWPINTDKLLTVAGGPFTITSEDLYYLFAIQVGTTLATLLGAGIPSAFGQISPVLGASLNPSGLTDPASAPASFTLNAGNGHAYGWVE